MTRRRLWIAAGLLAAALLALVPLACERVVREVEVGYRGAARLNPYLAAERLFHRLGVGARTSERSFGMPDPGHALLMVRTEQPLSSEEGVKLLRWVEKGGQLIYAVPPAEAGRDGLIDGLLHVERRPTRYRVEGMAGEDVVEIGLMPGSERARVAVPRRAHRLAELERPRVVAGSAFISVGTEEGALLLTYRFGPGRLTLLADASFLRNENIGRHDHARLAWHLLQWSPRPESVVIVFRRGRPSLLALLARHAWPALLSAVVLAAACLWRAGARFGPMAPDPPPDRRALLEHVEAAGELLWRQGRAGDLVEASRQALLRRVEWRQPGWARLPRRELAARLAAAAHDRPGGAHLGSQRVAEALEGGVPNDPTDVLTTIQTLETLRRSL